MADSSASALILFIAAVAVAAGVAGMLTMTVEDISSAIDVRGENVAEEVRSDITVISDPGSEAAYSEDTDGNGTISVYVKNTGANSLPPRADAIDVLVDGQYETVSQVTEPGSDTELTQWQPGDVAELEISHTLDDNESEARVLVHVQGSEDDITIYRG